jgi:hypothetical protein
MIKLVLVLLLVSMTISLREKQHFLRDNEHDVEEEWVQWCLKQGGIVCGWIGKECCRAQCGVSTKFPWFFG